MNKFKVTVKSNPGGWLMVEASNDVYTFETNETLQEIANRLMKTGFPAAGHVWIMPAAILQIKEM